MVQMQTWPQTWVSYYFWLFACISWKLLQDGFTPLKVAEQQEHKEVVALLKEQPQKS